MRHKLYKHKRWYDFLPPDKLFLVPPSFWAFIAGTLVAMAVNLLTGFLLDESRAILRNLWVSIALFFLSGVAFATVSVFLEGCRVKTRSLPLEIHESKLSLSLSFLLGSLFLILGVVFVRC